MDVSILIVHYNTPGLLRQTLKGIRRSLPSVVHEVIVVDNNPDARIGEMMKEFPEVKLIESAKNAGFGAGMNAAMKVATGRYLFVFNPDIALFSGVLEELVRYMDANPKVGMCGPQLLNPDGSLQLSCYRFMRPMTVIGRRVSFSRLVPSVRADLDAYLMKDWDHKETRDVDYLLGAAMFARREAIEAVGGFDEAFFVYFEEQDWCRRFWKAGWRVVYHPAAKLVHYHRRETAEGGLLAQLLNPLTHIQIRSAIYYFRKYRNEPHPSAGVCPTA